MRTRTQVRRTQVTTPPGHSGEPMLSPHHVALKLNATQSCCTCHSVRFSNRRQPRRRPFVGSDANTHAAAAHAPAGACTLTARHGSTAAPAEPEPAGYQRRIRRCAAGKPSCNYVSFPQAPFQNCWLPLHALVGSPMVKQITRQQQQTMYSIQ